MKTQRHIYEFDEFRVDTGQFVLCKGRQTQAMTPTVFKILIALLERAGQVVTKDELIRNVWEDCFVEEGNLNRNISTLRKALGEKPKDHTYIETLHKTGYRFVAQARRLDYQPATGSRKMKNACAAQRLVGRDHELQELRERYETAQSGRGRLTLINGDAGLGKTALVDAFLDDLAGAGHSFHLARARCSEALTDGEPLIPWLEAFGNLAREDTIKELMERSAPGWYREIFHKGAGQMRKMKRELVDFFHAVSPVHPLIVVLDDFQWSDVTSVDLLAHISARLESSRVLILVCYRLNDMKVSKHPYLQVRSDLLSQHSCTELNLGLLESNDKSEGNPLFMRQVAQSGGEITETIKNMIMRKIDRVSDTDRALLTTASAQGREFDSAILARSLRMKPEDVEERLRVLDEVHGLILRIREEQLPEGKFTVRYRFVYVFYQEVCFSLLSPTRKASLNASLAEALLAYYGN